MKKPNILLVMWHDLGTYLGTYGIQQSPSPNIDRLARQGVRLDNYFACFPVCCPSRSGMMTGLMPHTNGVSGQINRGWDMRRDITPLPQVLRDAGYCTYLSSFSHECQDPVWEGFEAVERIPDAEKPAYAAGIFEKFRDGDRPFFLTITTHAVHRPFGDVHDPEIASSLDVPPWMADDECNRIDLACFHRYVQEADAGVGEMLLALDRTGLADDTLVIFTTDHGMPFARAKHTQFDPGLKISFVARWKGHIESGSTTNELLSNLDFMPTVLDLVGIPMPESTIPSQGRSFAPLLLNGELSGDRPEASASWTPRNEVFAEHTYGVMYSPSRTIRTDRYKYITHFEPRTPIMHEPFVVHRCGEDKVNEWFSAPVPPEELYDLEKDPAELQNLANSPHHGAIRRDLRTRLYRFLESTDDPLLKGPIADPSAAGDTPAKTIPGEWSLGQYGLYNSDLPEIWHRDKFKSRS